MAFDSLYPHYVAKVKKKGMTLEELHEVISWLTISSVIIIAYSRFHLVLLNS
ncbi:MAG: DUF2200 family protein [Bacteroidetes bacterium]|nr:DUF2200 family protein [Bacteroidota bacterium]